ncbi:MAG: GntP family permease [Bacteroidia bacterium]|nr:GntP family permease [Bacteroidia bacterium]
MQELLASPYWPFAVLAVGIIAVVVMISRLRIHPFIALILTSIIVGLISVDLPVAEGMHPLVAAVELPMQEFGSVAGKITWVIALAAIIGAAMMESGAAERIVTSLLHVFGEEKASIALLLGGFILSIPVFFDTVFFLLIPLAIALALKTGKDYVLYVVAIAGGAVVTHILVPPTPGPLIMAETLQIDLGITIIAGLLVGIIPAASVIWIGRNMENRLHIPVRGTQISSEKSIEGPSLLVSIMPVLIPILMISLASIFNVLMENSPGWIQFIGNKNIAMGMGAAIAVSLWAKEKDLDAKQLWEGIANPLEIAGIIILITSAGGAFGAMIKHSGIGEAIELATSSFHIHYILLAWIISAVMKTAQGSSTVAMITAASIVYALIGDGSQLDYHPIYILLAVGFGSGFISWMNDSGFWIVSRMAGFNEKETLQTWTTMFALVSVIGLIEVMILSYLVPLV